MTGWGNPHPVSKRRAVTIFIGLTCVLTLGIVVEQHNPNYKPIKCEMVYDDSDHAQIPQGFSYEGSEHGGIWYTQNGGLFGYSMFEDSIIWNLPYCEPTYHGK